MDVTRTPRENLDPPRWLRLLPRRSAALRGLAVAALLALAAVVLQVEPAPVAPRAATARGATAPGGTVGYPLRLPDPGMGEVLQQGQHLDVLTATADSSRVLVSDVLVLRATSDTAEGTLVYLAVTRAQAGLLAANAPESRLSVTVRAP